MRILVSVFALVLIALMLAEFFLTFLLPHRVRRDPRIARRFIVFLWKPWRAVARKLSPGTSDTLLGIFGPLALVTLLALWTSGLILGFALLHWAHDSHLTSSGNVDFGDDIYFSAASFFSASTNLTPHDSLARALLIAEAVSGFAVLFIVIGYLPALFQAFSRREVAVSELDPRAGSPPSAGGLLLRAGRRGGWAELDEYLAQWERWAAELMETHLSYPILAYYRSQHVNQNWLAALTTVMDSSSFAISAAPAATPAAELTFAIGRHALADLSLMFDAKPVKHGVERLDDAALSRLLDISAEAGLEVGEGEAIKPQLDELRARYEPYAIALSRRLELPLSEWVRDEQQENWQLATWRARRAGVFH
jgi:hypothetical protein